MALAKRLKAAEASSHTTPASTQRHTVGTRTMAAVAALWART